MNIIDFIQSFLGYIFGAGGVIYALFYYRQTKRLKSAEANKSEIANEKSFAEEWKKIAEDREVKIVAKDSKIDVLYLEIAQWRDANNTLLAENNRLEMALAIAEFKECQKKGCENRTPPTGF